MAVCFLQSEGSGRERGAEIRGTDILFVTNPNFCLILLIRRESVNLVYTQEKSIAQGEIPRGRGH